MVMIYCFDLVDEIEKVFCDEVYDGGFGYMGVEQFMVYVCIFVVMVVKVVEEVYILIDDEWEVQGWCEVVLYVDDVEF